MRFRFESLQALRGVASLLVAAFHLANVEMQYGLSFNPLKPTQWFGYAGVDLFFVLSGFIIASTCRNDLGLVRRLPAYAFRRVWRIYPVYWAAFVLAVLTFAWLSPESLLRAGWKRELFDSLLLLPQEPLSRMLPVAWTLSYELMFYLAFGMLFLLPRRAAAPAFALWAVAVVGLAIADQTPANRFAQLAVSPFVLEFLAGCVLAAKPVALSGRAASALLIVAAAWAGVGSLLDYHPDPDWLQAHTMSRVLVFGPAAAFAVLACTGWERTSAWRGPRWLSAVGNASYSIYLTHLPALIVMQYLTMLVHFPHNRSGHLAWLGIMFAGAIVPGLLLHRFVEAPLLRFGKKARSRVEAPAEPPIRLAA